MEIYISERFFSNRLELLILMILKKMVTKIVWIKKKIINYGRFEKNHPEM
jgi:hypothetical protein